MTDFGAVVAELRLFHHNAAADAVEALVAENEKLRGQIERDRVRGAEAVLNEQLRTVSAEAERDALQQQLDTDNFESMRARIGALESVIRLASEQMMLCAETSAESTLHMAPSVVLDEMIREAKAEAVEAARDAIMPPVNWNLRPDGTEMPGTQHIDEALHDIHVQLSGMAADLRAEAPRGQSR